MQKLHLLITSSRRPTRSIRTLMRDLHTVIPNSHRMNRGKMSIEDLVETASNLKTKYVLIVDRWRGGPGKIEFYRVLNRELQPLSPILYVRGVRLQREYKIFWRKLRIRCRSLAIIKPVKEKLQKLAKTLSTVFNSPLVSETEKDKFQVYIKLFEGLGYEVKITFFSTLHNTEIGPALYLKKVVEF